MPPNARPRRREAQLDRFKRSYVGQSPPAEHLDAALPGEFVGSGEKAAEIQIEIDIA